MTNAANQVESVCVCCGSPVPQIPGAHRRRRYCDNNGQCKQGAYRARRKEKQKQEIRERWPAFRQETLDYLEWLMTTPKYGDRFAIALAELISKEHDHQRHAIETSPLAGEQVAKLEQALEEERAKSTTLLDDYMQLAKKTSNLESQVQRFQRMKVLRSRESMLQELMLLGGRLKYASMTNLGIQEGIDQWLNYIRAASDEDLAKAISHGYYQADSLAMAAIEASEVRTGIEMRQRIDALERDMALRDARIAELEHGQSESWEPGDELSKEQIQELMYHARERQAIIEHQIQRIAELEREVREKITKIHELQESHSSTMFAMNNLLAAAQTAQREGAVSEQQLEKDLNAVRVNVASEALLKTPYGQALLAVKTREDEITHLKMRIEKQYERRIVKQQARIQELEGETEKQSTRKADATELEQARADLRQLRQERAHEQEHFHEIYELANDQRMRLSAAHQRMKDLEQEIARYSQICDLNDRQRLETQAMAYGEQIGFKHLVSTPKYVKEGPDAWRQVLQEASDEQVATICATARHYAENLIWLDAQEELRQAHRRIQFLEKQVQQQQVEGMRTEEHRPSVETFVL